MARLSKNASLSKKQSTMIVSFMQKNPRLAIAPPAGVQSMLPAKKAALWQKLSDNLNAEARKTGQGAQKPVGTWIRTWYDMKASMKKRRMYATSIDQLTGHDRKIIDLIESDVFGTSKVEPTVPEHQKTRDCSVVLHNRIDEEKASTIQLPSTSTSNAPSTSRSTTKPKRKYTRRIVNANRRTRSTTTINQPSLQKPKPDLRTETSTNSNRPRVSEDSVSMTEGHSTELPRAHQTESKSIQAVADAIVAHNAIQRQRNKLLKRKNSLHEQMLELKKRKVTAIELAVEKFLDM